MNNILVRQENSIGYLTINRPKALNALNKETLLEIHEAVKTFEDNPEVHVVILTGVGDKAFVAGADIKEMQPLSAIEGRELARIAQKAFSDIEHSSKIYIAAINGYALGGGCEIALACDIRLASDNAMFGQPEVSLGITPGFAGTQRLQRVIPMGKAKELIYTGKYISADEAYRLGLANEVYPLEDLLSSAEKMANDIMKNAPIAVTLSKAAINDGQNMDTESSYKYEADIFGLCFSTADQKEGMDAFINKRKAEFNNK